jgi:hypothetical protein
MHNPTDPSVVRRFMAKVALPDDPDECWLWTATSWKAYGIVRLNYRKLFAHRLAYEMFIGPIPPGLEVDHMCHTTLCVNPRHLRAVTNKQNLENRSGATRISKSGVRGVTWKTEKSRWQVDVTHNGVNHYGGKFRDLHEAEAAAIALRNQLFTHNDADRKIGA